MERGGVLCVRDMFELVNTSPNHRFHDHINPDRVTGGIHVIMEFGIFHYRLFVRYRLFVSTSLLSSETECPLGRVTTQMLFGGKNGIFCAPPSLLFLHNLRIT